LALESSDCSCENTFTEVFSAVFALCVAAWADCARCFSVDSAERCLLKFLSTLFLRSSAEGLVVWMNAVTSPFAC